MLQYYASENRQRKLTEFAFCIAFNCIAVLVTIMCNFMSIVVNECSYMHTVVFLDHLFDGILYWILINVLFFFFRLNVKLFKAYSNYHLEFSLHFISSFVFFFAQIFTTIYIHIHKKKFYITTTVSTIWTLILILQLYYLKRKLSLILLVM